MCCNDRLRQVSRFWRAMKNQHTGLLIPCCSCARFCITSPVEIVPAIQTLPTPTDNLVNGEKSTCCVWNCHI